VNKSVRRLSDGLGGRGGGSGNRRWCEGNQLNKQWDTIAVHHNSNIMNLNTFMYSVFNCIHKLKIYELLYSYILKYKLYNTLLLFKYV